LNITNEDSSDEDFLSQRIRGNLRTINPIEINPEHLPDAPGQSVAASGVGDGVP